jgi:transcriptional regulator with XRE-family HTH domain
MSQRKHFTPGGGDLIRARRIELGMPLRDLAERIGISAAHVSRIETNFPGASPSEDALVAIADALDLDTDDVLAAFGRVPSDLASFIVESGDAIRAVRALFAGRGPA